VGVLALCPWSRIDRTDYRYVLRGVFSVQSIPPDPQPAWQPGSSGSCSPVTSAFEVIILSPATCFVTEIPCPGNAVSRR
jgi:hypothetical protein